ncbi:MAG: M18 family aminopeptidase [Ruminococcaceae bacterium]|nr:M18 family aminopeptidase [Oscillospiraceae bacterium]
MNERLFDYIASSPTAYHACAHTAKLLSERGYIRLCEGDNWSLESGKGYFVERNGSSIIAFRLPCVAPESFVIAAAHADSPCFKVKDNAEIAAGKYMRLSVEKYGGMLCSTWLDRPLSVAGRLAVRTERGMDVKLFDVGEPCALIPNVAIHMNRQANDGMSYNPAVDMIPLFESAAEEKAFCNKIALAAGVNCEDVVATDAYLYNPACATEWGEYISAPRIDDLQCAFAALEAFLGAQESTSVPVYALFDNEEVGSQTKQGAASTFLYDVLCRVNAAMGGNGETYARMVANSFMASCDNGHAVHPNHPEYADKNHSVYMNGGVVIKYNANQKYTSDGVSAGIFKLVCERAGVPYQLYCNRADMAGGSTLGNIANTQVSLNTVDIGLAQLAMHSSFETAGARDTEYMVKALTELYSMTLLKTSQGYQFK